MKRTNESGRSMVEMLGVLAIIGVLSIGGIAGYTSAMNRYRANEALDIATKYAAISYAGAQTKKTMDGSLDYDSYTPQTISKTGLTGTDSKVHGASITIAKGGVQEDKVTVSIVFENGKVCRAAASSVGTATTKCTGDDTNGYTLTYEIKQS